MSKILPLLMGGSAVAGTVGNIGANRSRNAVLKQQMDYTTAMQKLTPAQIMQGITSLQNPLQANLVKGVTNNVQGEMASRGLSQAPGIFAQALGQGLAPYQLQEQQLAQDAYFKKLGLPIQSRPSPFGPFPQQTNISQTMQALAQRFMKPGGQPNDFSYWGKNATPYSPNGINASLPDLSNTSVPSDSGIPDWLASMSATGLAPGTGG